MLDKHLIAKVDPVVNENNIIINNNFRISILQDRLIRIEKSKNFKFEDNATQSVWFRNFGKVDYEYKVSMDIIEISTNTIKYCIDTKIFEESYCYIDNKKTLINNDENLLGTYRTLDRCDGNLYYDRNDGTSELEIGFGVCSKNGVAVIDDRTSLILKKDGKLYERDEEEIDCYVFAYGRDYVGAVKGLYLITGKPPMIPRYALGNWWSRYYDYTEKEYLHLLDDFKNAGVPISVATIDMDWHYSNFVDKELNIPQEYLDNEDIMAKKLWCGYGWTGYTWNKNYFPDYKKFLKEIKNRDIKITLNLHPADGIRYFETQYEDFCKGMGLDSSSKKAIKFDITDDNFINNYFKLLHKPYENDGVEFWWIDWQQGTNSKLKGLDPLWSLNHYHTLDNAYNHKYPLIMSRYCGVGSHRYPLGFSGDTYSTWKTLDYIPKFTNTSSNIGYTWWSHDIGGHMRKVNDGKKIDDIMVRYIQYGVFNPILRTHTSKTPVITNKPESYTNGRKYLIEEQYKLRHRLVPYIYTADYQCATNGETLIKPLYYVEPNEEKTYEYKNTYMFGSELLIVPITCAGVNGVSSVKSYIPNGYWTDIFTGAEYKGGKTYTFNRYLDSIPVLAKSGAVVPFASKIEGNNPSNPTSLDVLIYKGNNTYTMYEDNDNEEKLFTKFVVICKNNTLKVKIKAAGDKNVMPINRSVKLVFKQIQSGDIEILKNNKPVSCEIDDNRYVTININDFEVGSEYVVKINYNKTYIDYAKLGAFYVLTHSEDLTSVGEEFYNAILTCKTKQEVKKLIYESKLSNLTKKLLREYTLNV